MFTSQKEMKALTIILTIVALLLYPLSVLYITGQKKKPMSRFSDEKRTRRALMTMRVVSIVLLLTALYLLEKLGTNLFS